MKKTFVDLTYYSFQNIESDNIIDKCQSTIGFLKKGIFETHFVVRTKFDFESIKKELFTIHFFKGETLKKWQMPFRFNQYIKSLRPDFVLVHGFGFAHYLIFLKLICPKVKIILQCNGFAQKPTGFKKIVYKISDLFIDGYLFTGIENAKDWYENSVFKKEKVFEVMEGSTNFEFDNTILRDENSYLWVGDLNKNKDPMTILKAFNQFLGTNPLAKLSMIYNENDLLSEVEIFISENEKLRQSVDLKGYVANNLLEKIYNQHRFFILGSHYEGSGYALLEAMACGCFPIVTNIPSYKFMTNNGDCGLLFSPSNEAELLEKLLVSRNIDFSTVQSKVLNQFQNKLSFQAIANEIQDAFQSL